MALFLSVLPTPFSWRLRENPGNIIRASPKSRRKAISQPSLPAYISSKLQEDSHVIRRQTSFHPTVWEDSFLESLTAFDMTTVASTTQRIDELKETVQCMLINENNPLKMMNLVDNIERLGLAYQFEKEIQSTLQQVYEECDIDDSLHVVSLRFRLLRQAGYDASCDVFDKFKDKDGKFKQNLSNDVRGLLSLYEASQLRTHGEDILDEALEFSTNHLKSACIHSNPSLATYIEQALSLPLHKSIPRLEARRFISFYEKDEERNNVLLELAKLDFNLLQSLHRKEIKEIAKWRKDMDFTGELPFARDRLVALYLWGLEMNFLPQFSQGRIAIVKFLTMLTLLDDMYEVYGTLDELELFTNAFARWDLTAIEQLPVYMKLRYVAIYNLFNEIEYISLKDRRSSSISYLRKEIGVLCTVYMQEARWFHSGYVPTMDEYLKVATPSTNGFILMVVAALGMKELTTKEAIDYMLEESKLPWLLSLVCRFIDDLAPSQDEKERSDIPKSVQCYMKEHGVSKEVAEAYIKHQITQSWKEINRELLQPNPLPKPLVKGLVNFGRLCETIFVNGNDGLGDSKIWSIDLINSLFFEPIPM